MKKKSTDSEEDNDCDEHLTSLNNTLSAQNQSPIQKQTAFWKKKRSAEKFDHAFFCNITW